VSVVIVLIPIAIAISMSLGSSTIATLVSLKPKNKKNLEPVETVFMDGQMLVKTLSEHGLTVKQENKNEFFIETKCGTLHYFRTEPSVPFSLEVLNVNDMDSLISSLNSLENEYGRNVQAFTYDKVKSSLAENNMSVACEEVLEDDSVLLTLNM